MFKKVLLGIGSLPLTCVILTSTCLGSDLNLTCVILKSPCLGSDLNKPATTVDSQEIGTLEELYPEDARDIVGEIKVGQSPILQEDTPDHVIASLEKMCDVLSDFVSTASEDLPRKTLEKKALKIFLADVADSDYADLYKNFSYADNRRIISRAGSLITHWQVN